MLIAHLNYREWNALLVILLLASFLRGEGFRHSQTTLFFRPTGERNGGKGRKTRADEFLHVFKGEEKFEGRVPPLAPVKNSLNTTLKNVEGSGTEETDMQKQHTNRFVPKVAWDRHHQATMGWMRSSNDIIETKGECSNDYSAVGQHQPRSQGLKQKVSKLFSQDFQLVSSTKEWKELLEHRDFIQSTHLRDLLKDKERCDAFFAEEDGVYVDYSRNRATEATMKLLFQLAEKQDLKGKIQAMANGEKINFTEKRAVLHTACRADRDQIGTVYVDDVDVIGEVHQVLDEIKTFTEGVRSGEILGYTGKRLRNIVSVGIGGSYLGPEFLHESLKTEPEGINAALGYSLRFLSNVDPVDVERTCANLDPEETLIVIVSKTFTTSETMLNARTMRQWLWDFMGNDKEVVRRHIVACASISSIEKVADFGIDTKNYFFRFWDWVGGRYSVCSAAGAVPISLLYGYDLFEKFLQGARSMDTHFFNAPFESNIPVILGLLGVWNMSFLGYNTRATLPYGQALLKLPAHIQQLDMESNGKYMTRQNIEIDYPVGEVDFGEPGTNGQHSFYQLLHMGQTVPCDFIGFVQSQHDLCLDGEELSSHDELMANFFAQPDALANGKTTEELRLEGCPEGLIPHRSFKGNRPSNSMLLPKLTAYATGQILSLYEHRTAVQGFIWDINSFDQYGVELGKKLAIDVRNHLKKARNNGCDKAIYTGSPATDRILNYYLQNNQKTLSNNANKTNGFGNISKRTQRDVGRFPPSDHNLGGQNGKL